MTGVSEESDTEGDRRTIGHDDGHNWSAVDQICPMSPIVSVYCLVPIGLALGPHLSPMAKLATVRIRNRHSFPTQSVRLDLTDTSVSACAG